MSNEHTPTTDRMRDLFSFAVAWDAEPTELHIIAMQDKARKEFDRWLDARDDKLITAAEQRGAIKALRDAATQMESTADTLGEHYILPGDIISWLRHRADQMEGDNE